MTGFQKYKECEDVVNTIQDEELKEHAKSISKQLLHLAQARHAAIRAYRKYSDEMNEWENELVRNVKRIAKEASIKVEKTT